MRLNWLNDAAIRSNLDSLTTAQLLSLNKSIHSPICSGTKAKLVESASRIIRKYAPLITANQADKSPKLSTPNYELFSFSTGTKAIDWIHLIPNKNTINMGTFEYNLPEKLFDPYEGTKIAAEFITEHLKGLLSQRSRVPLVLLSSKISTRGNPFGIFRFPNAMNCMLLDMLIHSQLFQAKTSTRGRTIFLDQITLGEFNRNDKRLANGAKEQLNNTNGVQLVASKQKTLAPVGKATKMTNYAHLWLMTQVNEGVYENGKKFKEICQRIDEYSKQILCAKAFFDILQTLNQLQTTAKCNTTLAASPLL